MWAKMIKEDFTEEILKDVQYSDRNKGIRRAFEAGRKAHTKAQMWLNIGCL